jgi:holo-[acyl-carrier protein] synthase
MLPFPQAPLKPRTLFHRKNNYIKINNNQIVKLSTPCPTSSTTSRTSSKKMGMGIGIDIASVERITQLINRYDRATLNLLFTFDEIDLCQSAQNSYQKFAVCFAAKEAVGKALGTGLAGIDWHEIEAIVSDFQLNINLYGKAKLQANRLGYTNYLASWSSCNDYVLVHVLAY